ncbi:unnamed protein product [Rhizoctonia solani]|uniref:Telomere replication protein EST3 n=1 Tax=Rhizoctonia solani TaxID=456999 RepID=A0A8H3AG34_9AGAM|nr:unnamed protein product [Rhizoctonia solani]
MSESLGKPWIESLVVDILVDHAHELPSPFKLQSRAQIVKFLTFRKDAGDGNQPKDRDTVLWAEITDGEWIIPVRIANEATNKIEDEYNRSLTYYRRGFFTFKAAVSFDFVGTQPGKSQTKLSPLRNLFLDIAELQYISGGGPEAPVATRAVALQTPPVFHKWVQALNTGGQTLTNLQAQERAANSAIRSSRMNSRRPNVTNASKRASKAPIKSFAQPITPKPSISNLAAKREWQEGWFGKRSKLHEADFIPRSEGFEPTADQRAKIEAIIERIKLATPTHPYDPTSANGLSAPDRPSGASIRSSQIIRSSQVMSSTPLDTRPTGSQPIESQLRTPKAVEESVHSSSDAESNEEDSDSDHGAPVRSQQTSRLAMNQASKAGHSKCHIPTPRPSDARADGIQEEDSEGVEDTSQSLEADDAVTEQVLSQAFSSGSQRRKAPTVLVPDSDPPNPSQRFTQVRHSSPWDCESVSPLEQDISYSPETTRRIPTQGSQRPSPTLSSPSRPILDASHDESMNSESIGQMTSGAKQQGGQVEAQPSAAASLPSPPPEDSNGQMLMQQSEPMLSRRADETAILPLNLPHPRGASLQRDSKNGSNEEHAESFETRPSVDRLASRKRRLSQSQGDDTPHAQLPQELESSIDGRPVTKDKRRRLDDSNARIPANKNAPRQLSVARGEGPVNQPMALSNTAKPTDLHNRTDVIPHDHEAWANPTWMNNLPASKQVKLIPAKALRTAEARPLDKPHTRRIPRPSTGLRILPPPSHSPRTVEHAPSPGFPPATASQFADADEDFRVANPKAEPLTPARPANKPVAPKPRISNIVQSTPIPGGQSTATVTGHSKKSRASSGVLGNGTRVTQVRKDTVRNGGHTSEGQAQKGDSSRPLTAHQSTSDNSLANSEARTDDSATQSVNNTTAPRPYLGGFQPSIKVDLPRKYQLTWEKWLEVTKDAYTFWLE